jgi:hypothetical protein
MNDDDNLAPLFVIFDTSTHSRYYSDVHELMALPPGAVIRYEYKRYLCTHDASTALDKILDDPAQLPVNAVIMYGEKRAFKKGDPDPTDMLRQVDSIFVPTRSCRIVNVGKLVGASREEDTLHFHLEVRGFVDPGAPVIDEVVGALESLDSLPFGPRGVQSRWVSLLPRTLSPRRSNLVTENSVNWSKVVDAMIGKGAQFKDDVFWRICAVREVATAGVRPAPLVKRPSNKPGDTDLWHVDYELHELKRYEIVIETHSPQAHGRNVPGDATVVLTGLDDEDTLLKLPSSPVEIVPNQSAVTRFSVAASLRIAGRTSGLRLETQIPGVVGPYPPGSSATLSVAIRKERWRLFGGAIALLSSVALGALASTLGDAAATARFESAAGAAICAMGAYWLFRGELKLGS